MKESKESKSRASRREFSRFGGAATAGLGALWPGPAGPRVGVVLVGLGKHATSKLAPALPSKPNPVSGEAGLKDMRVIEAVDRASGSELRETLRWT